MSVILFQKHGIRDYFLLEHYIPETMSCAIENVESLKQELIKAHISKAGLENEKAEQDFIMYAQSLPHYGGHFYTATWVSKLMDSVCRKNRTIHIDNDKSKQIFLRVPFFQHLV